jgi:hypothetical protein
MTKERVVIRGGPLDGTKLEHDPTGESPDTVIKWQIGDGAGGTGVLEPDDGSTRPGPRRPPRMPV